MKASELLTVARAEIGVKESPAGSNKVKYNTDYYGREVSGLNLSWCMVFVWWCFKQAGGSALFYNGGKTASCGTLMYWAKSIGKWAVKDYRPGDIAIMDFGNDGEQDHVGIVESVSSAGLVCIEGNTSLTSNDNGGAVMRRERPYKYIMGAYRPDFESEEDIVPRYNTMKEIPGWARDTIKKLCDRNYIKGGGAAPDENNYPTDMNLSEDMLRLLVMNDRAGLYE